ncbi:MAG: carbohydrate porin, partial [Bacteroidales bacterium]
MLKILISALIFLESAAAIFGQLYQAKPEVKWTSHFQTTVIAQQHLAFKAAYSGANILADTSEPAATSLTATLFLGRKLWKGAAIYFNPEVAGGRGLSSATGVAGGLNGETFRVGNPEPQVYIARLYVTQYIPLGNSTDEEIADGLNQVEARIPENHLAITLGKFPVTDFFDDNLYSQDPRTQFLNWSLMANGAWDYPADARGYTMGLVIEAEKKKWRVRFSSVALPKVANGSHLEYRIPGANSETLEFLYRFSINRRPGNIRTLIYSSFYRGPSYAGGIRALNQNDKFLLDVFRGLAENKSFGGRKFGFGISLDHELSDNAGLFFRAGWNDGKYSSWSFTEIDRTINAGVSLNGVIWNRPGDILGIGAGLNGISQDHRSFLEKGGYGFIIGDGRLNYGLEHIVELFYNIRLNKFLWFTVDY